MANNNNDSSMQIANNDSILIDRRNIDVQLIQHIERLNSRLDRLVIQIETYIAEHRGLDLPNRVSKLEDKVTSNMLAIYGMPSAIAGIISVMVSGLTIIVGMN